MYLNPISTLPVMRFRLFAFFILSLLSLQVAHAQKEHNNWYFGLNAGITFNTIPPVALPISPMTAPEGCASISDSSGKLLFYTNSVAIWDASHSYMLNSGGLAGDVSGSQAVIIVPHPTNYDRYYVFTSNYNQTLPVYGLNYSIVDMTLNGGLGAVTSKNINIYSNGLTEHLTAVRHSNGVAYWIIVKPENSNNFLAFLLTAAGINPAPVVSSVGTALPGAPSARVGCIKGSPDGKILAFVTLATAGAVEVFDFDNSTGIVSNARILDNQSSYGVEFSPNSSKLYVAETNGLFQFDLSAGSLSAIQSSKTLLDPVGFWSLQLAPDNKIYVATVNLHLNRINAPDIAGIACGYQSVAVALNSSSAFGLPNYIGRVQLPFVYTDDPVCFGDTTFFTFNDIGILDSVLWDFDDPGSGAMNQSKLLEPFHIFSDTGTFIVSATIDFTPLNSSTPVHTTIYDTVRILPLPDVDLGPDTVICPGDSIVYLLNVSNIYYVWENHSTSPYHVIKEPGKYWVTAKNNFTQCKNSDTILLGHIPALNIPYDFQDTSLCDGDFFTLNARYPGVDYFWQDGSTHDHFDINAPGKYWVKWENACESVSDTLNVVYLADINLDLGTDTVFCFGHQLLLDAGQQPEATYLWQDGSPDSKFTAIQPGIYWVKAENKCEAVSDTITLSHLFPPDVYLGENLTLCRNSSKLLDAKNEGSSYLWQDGSTGQFMWVTREGTYWVDVINTCGTDHDSILSLYTYPPRIQLGEDTVICNNTILTLDATNDASTYRWQNGSTEPVFYVDREGVYSVEIKNPCGEKKDEISVKEKDCTCPLFAPNAFTPGSDGLNEEFRVYCPCDLSEFELIIYNRWGEEIFRSNYPDAGWDGTVGGQQAPTGPYAWKLRCVITPGNNREEKVSSGTVKLLR